MKKYTYTEARQHLSSVLEKARKEGEVMIRRKDGQLFVLRPASRSGSPLDVPGIDLNITTEELIGIQREIRERGHESAS